MNFFFNPNRHGNIIDPSFKHGKNFKIGNYCIIKEDCEVGDNVTIKDYVRLASNTKIGNNCVIDSYVKSSGQNSIGDNVTIRYDSIIAREVTVEDDVFISPQVMTIYSTHKGVKKGGIVIGKGAFIGTNVTIGAGVKIGPNVIIGAKALVTKDCLKEGVYVGIPARIICSPD